MWPIAKPGSERRVALVVVVVFLLVGIAWILFTDLLLYSLTHDRVIVARLETAKGWAFVGLTALLLYVVTLRSAAKLTQASRTISAVVESIGDGVLLLGADRRIAYANPASVQMLGTNLDELRGMGAPEFSRRFHVSYPDGRLVPPDQFVSQRVFDESGPIRYKAILHPPGGREVVISCTAAGVRSDLGAPAEIVVSVMHDITVTEQLDHLRNELFTAAAHAMKTPVAVIKSASQVLATTAPFQARRSIAIIERQCARMERLVENVLVLSRLRTGTLQLHPAAMELAPLIERVADDFARLSPGNDILVHVAARPRIRADPERFVLVLRNAIHGAMRSSQPGSPVRVSLTAAEMDADVTVSYDPLVPVGEALEAVQATDFDDLGVARYVTTMILEAHGGTLREDSAGGVTTIRIRVPVLIEGLPDA